MALADQRIVGWDETERAASISIQPLFERFPGFIRLFNEVDRIVIRWVRQFYATLWIHLEHDFIGLILDGRPERLYYNHLQQLLGVDSSDRKLHQIVYRDALPPRRSRAGGTFPTDQEIWPLFMEPFTNGSLHTPDRLRLEAYVLYMALRKTVLPSGGNRESLTSLQQWLLLSIWRVE
jgi:hypothetical protein